VRAEIRRRIVEASATDIHFDLKITAGPVTLWDIGRVSIPAGAIVGAIADLVLGDPIFSQTVQYSAGDAVKLQSVRAQQQTVQQSLDGKLSQQDAQTAAGQLVPAAPPSVSVLTPQQREIMPGGGRIEVELGGANRTFVEPTLGVPRRVAVRLNGQEVPYLPEDWADVAEGIAYRAHVVPIPPAPPAEAVPAAPGAIAQLQTGTQLRATFTGPNGSHLVLTALGSAGPAAAPEGPERIAVMDSAEVFGSQADHERAMRTVEEALGGEAVGRPLPVAGDGVASAGSGMEAMVETAPAPAAPQPAARVVAPDGRPVLSGVEGLNMLEVAVSDGSAPERVDSSAVVFFLTPAEVPEIAIGTIAFAQTGPEARGEFVEITSTEVVDVDMTGWTLRDIARHVFHFPLFVLPAGSSVRVWTGRGADDAENLYWGRRAAVWNDRGDTAMLHDRDGHLVSRYIYVPVRPPRRR
jgi:hypothetical protein